MSPTLPAFFSLAWLAVAPVSPANVFLSLTEIQQVHTDCTRGLCGICASPDGKHIYTGGTITNVVGVFSVNKTTGKLTAEPTASPKDGGGLLGVKISPDGKYVAAFTHGSGCATVFQRKAEDGSLTEISSFTKTDNAAMIRIADCVFSPDSKHLYVASLSNGILVLSAADGKLTLVEQVKIAGVLETARSVAVHPDGKLIAVCVQATNSVAMFTRDPASGKLTHCFTAKEGDNGIAGIEGIFRAAFSTDGKFLYTSSGRYINTSTVSVFAVQGGGKLTQRGKLDITGTWGEEWNGGNAVAISPVAGDTCMVVSASISDNIAELRFNPDTGITGLVGTLALGKKGPPGAAGLCFTPDGKFICAADQNEGTLYVFSCGAKGGK